MNHRSLFLIENVKQAGTVHQLRAFVAMCASVPITAPKSVSKTANLRLLRQIVFAELRLYKYYLIHGWINCKLPRYSAQYSTRVDQHMLIITNIRICFSFLEGNNQTRKGDILHGGKVCLGYRRKAALPRHPWRQRVLYHQVRRALKRLVVTAVSLSRKMIFRCLCLRCCSFSNS